MAINIAMHLRIVRMKCQQKKTVVMILVKVHRETVNRCLVGWMSSECPLIPKLKKIILNTSIFSVCTSLFINSFSRIHFRLSSMHEEEK